MCTFKITNYIGRQDIDEHLVLGGPDYTSTIRLNDIYITHNLLSITGEFTIQPVESNGLYFLLMGEIYNYDLTLPSDIFYAIQKYEEYGSAFTEYLDGEFLIIIINPTDNTIDFFTDPWSTKQVWFSKSVDGFYFGTYPLIIPTSDISHLNRKFDDNEWSNHNIRLNHNSHYRFNINENELYHINSEIHKWNLDQYKDTLSDVTIALENAIDKRYHSNSLLLLSGGIDSSVIAIRLAEAHKHIYSATLNFTDAEDTDTQHDVINYCSDYHDNTIFTHDISPLLPDNDNILKNMKISQSSDCIRQYFRVNYNCKVLITGNGSDEIFCNYMNKHNKIPEFTVFPTDLVNVFPWKNFYGGTHRRLIDLWETSTLHYGMETRSAFHDKFLIQEWLNLAPNLKNKEYKHFLKEYLRKRDIKIPEKIAAMNNQKI